MRAGKVPPTRRAGKFQRLPWFLYSGTGVPLYHSGGTVCRTGSGCGEFCILCRKPPLRRDLHSPQPQRAAVVGQHGQTTSRCPFCNFLNLLCNGRFRVIEWIIAHFPRQCNTFFAVSALYTIFSENACFGLCILRRPVAPEKCVYSWNIRRNAPLMRKRVKICALMKVYAFPAAHVPATAALE